MLPRRYGQAGESVPRGPQPGKRRTQSYRWQAALPCLSPGNASSAAGGGCRKEAARIEKMGQVGRLEDVERDTRLLPHPVDP
jgi:hypothetical protein